METHAFGFRLRANAPEGQKRFPISISHIASAGLKQVAQGGRREPAILARQCACGGICPRCHTPEGQKRFPIGRPHELLGRSRDALAATHQGDKDEREADKTADLVMNNQPSTDLTSDRAHQNTSSFSSTHSSASLGTPLEESTRTLMETRLGHDFSHVRVHTDAEAAGSARGVNARAYTVGNDIVFGEGQYHPSTDSSRRLIAHELAHVIQQRKTGQTVVARQTDQEYQEEGESIPRADVEGLVGRSYWEQKVMDVYELTDGTTRLSDDEERDAVLSVLWTKSPPGQITTQQVIDVHIPARVGTTISKPLLYKFIFRPKDPTIANSKPGVTVEFIGEGTSAVAVTPLSRRPRIRQACVLTRVQTFPLVLPITSASTGMSRDIFFIGLKRKPPSSLTS